MPQQANSAEQIHFERTIVRSLTGAADSEIEFDDFGWDSRVYVIGGGKIVFKFPRSASIQSIYPNEIAGLKLAARLNSSIQIPQVRWTAPDNSYFGYKGIIGVGLHTIIIKLTNTEKAELGKQIGNFLKTLHAKQLTAVPSISIDKEISGLQEKYNASRPIIKKYLSVNEMIHLDSFITETFPYKLRSLGMKSVLSHGDLGLWNMLHVKKNKLGFIDFEDIGYYDESKDFMGLDDHVLLDAALLEYGSNSVNLREKIVARSKITSISDVLFFDGKHSEVGLKVTMDKIKQFYK